ncbi:MAG TPA: alpha/beta hydrolase [Saprospiraceae bacterium]|nr:alpha/beta hydrolase [Saprospiraceae bacterium]HMQ84910.1 alpha/beta hydrolase [Saprospiraceae bacterium]
MKRTLKITASSLLALCGLFAIGPRPKFPEIDGRVIVQSLNLATLEASIAQQEAAVADLKPNNEGRIIWADSVRQTEYALVYLHGFSASPMEGEPTHREFARRYGMNLYIPRLVGHGLDDPDSFETLQPSDLVNSAKEALNIGLSLGKKVILMSCSTGSSLSIYLAAENPDLVEALIFYSPNIDLADPTSDILLYPWAEQLTQGILGKYRHQDHLKGTEKEKINTVIYRSSGLIALKALLEETMTPATFAKIEQPYFLGYYYKSETEQDPVVSVPAMLQFDAQTKTVVEKKRVVAFPDANTHVIPSEWDNPNVESVQKETYRFAEEVLQLKAVEKGAVN